MKSGLSIISFLFCALGVVSKMHHYIQGHLDFLLLSSISFRVLHFAFSFVIHFQWFLLKVKACEEDFFFCLWFPVISALFVWKLSLLHCIGFPHLSKNRWLYLWEYISGFYNLFPCFVCSFTNITLFWLLYQFSSVQSLSHVWLFAIPWIAACPASLSITNSRSLFKLMSIEFVMPSSHLILCRPLLLLPPIPPSIRLFSNESTLRIRWPKYWSFSFSINPSNEYPGLISFRMDWLDLLVVQGTLKSLLQHHSSKASIIWCSPFFTVQLTSIHDTGKTIALTRQTFVGKVMSLLFNMLSRFIVSLKDSVSAPTLFSFNIALAIQVFWLSR